MSISGTVSAIEVRMVPTKYGAKKVYDLVVDGTKYGAGFKDPSTMGISVGTVVSFEASGKYNNVDMATLVIGGKVSETAGTMASKTTASVPVTRNRNQSFPVPTDHADYAIIRQNALTNARELYNSQWYERNETGDSTSMEQMVQHAENVLKIAAIFEDYSSGQREVKAIEELKKKAGVTSISDAIARLNEAGGA